MFGGIKCQINAGNADCLPVLSLGSSPFLSKDINIEIYTTNRLFLSPNVMKLWTLKSKYYENSLFLRHGKN